jgi:hypothetical protein
MFGNNGNKLKFECEIWCLTLRDEHGLRVFENRVLRKMFGFKRNEVTGGWRKLHNEGPGAAIWSETNFGHTSHHHPRSSPLPHICTIPRASAIFLNAFWKSSSARILQKTIYN